MGAWILFWEDGFYFVFFNITQTIVVTQTAFRLPELRCSFSNVPRPETQARGYCFTFVSAPPPGAWSRRAAAPYSSPQTPACKIESLRAEARWHHERRRSCGPTACTDPSAWVVARSVIMLPGTIIRGQLFPFRAPAAFIRLLVGDRFTAMSRLRGRWAALNSCTQSDFFFFVCNFFFCIASGKQTALLCVMSALECPCQGKGCVGGGSCVTPRAGFMVL